MLAPSHHPWPAIHNEEYSRLLINTNQGPVFIYIVLRCKSCVPVGQLSGLVWRLYGTPTILQRRKAGWPPHDSIRTTAHVVMVGIDECIFQPLLFTGPSLRLF